MNEGRYALLFKFLGKAIRSELGLERYDKDGT